jgi:hypothetical protein
MNPDMPARTYIATSAEFAKRSSRTRAIRNFL